MLKRLRRLFEWLDDEYLLWRLRRAHRKFLKRRVIEIAKERASGGAYVSTYTSDTIDGVSLKVVDTRRGG